MRNHLKSLLIPYKHIQTQPYQFSVWLIVIIVFGLAGLWFPVMTEYFEKEKIFRPLHDFVRAGSMASFCIAILADGLAAALVAVGVGVSIPTAGIRGVYATIAIILVMLNVWVLNYVSRVDHVSSNYITLQIVITIVAIMLASGLYNLRTPDWEKSVEDATREQDEEISKLQRDAEIKKKDDEGVQL